MMISRLRLSAVHRRGGEFAARILAAGRVEGEFVHVPAEVVGQAQSRPVRQPVSVPIEQWPVPLRIMARRRIAGERGLGDTAARWLGHVGGERFKLWFGIIFGKDCGCKARQEWLNRRFPYEMAQENQTAAA